MPTVSHRPSRRTRWLPFLAACALFASCGKDVAASFPLSVEPLVLRASEDSRPIGQITRFAELEPGPRSKWRVRNGEGQVVKRAGGEQGWDYRVRQGDKMTVTIPGPFAPAGFNNVAVKLTVNRDVMFTFSAVTKSGKRYSSPRVTSAISGKPQVLHFDLEGFPTSGEKFRSVALSARDKSGLLLVHSLDLLFKPPGLYLPSPETGPEQIRAANQFRTGVAVGPERSVVSSHSVLEGSRLRFSYTQPRAYKLEADATLELTLSGSAGAVESHSFPLDDLEREIWHDVSLPLEAFDGQDLELRWSLPEGIKSTCAIAEVGIVAGLGEPRRVILITSDTHRADHLGSAGQGVDVRTPNLDALASAGVTFEDCFTSANVTNPSHIALMTATHPRDTGILNNHEPISAAATTMAEAFHEAGFATYASISTRHLSQRTSGLGQGFDRMAQPMRDPVLDADVAIRPMLKWLDESADVPTFIWVHLFDAHTPYLPPEEIADTYYENVDGAFDESLPELEGLALGSQAMYPGLRDLDMPSAMYRGEITYLDRELAQLFNHPTQSNAIIAFTADHGESLGHHSIYYSHSDLYPDSIHVPLILRFPGAPAGARFDTPVRQIDVGRTLLDLAGELDAVFPGRNLMVLSEEGNDQPRYALAAHGLNASVNEGGWHLILRLTAIKAREGSKHLKASALHSVQLYNLAEDPEALVDLVDREPARARELRRKLVNWMHAAEDRGWRGGLVTDAETLRQLEALGYTAGTTESAKAHELFPQDCACEWCARFGN